MRGCATLGPAICCAVVADTTAALDSSSGLPLAHLTAARDERESLDTT
jgi:hypothetical protein